MLIIHCLGYRRIQQIVRGVLTRIRVARWVYTRSKVITDWQAHTRRYVSNLHLRPVLFHEKKMIIRIQRIVRGKLARLRCQQILCNLVATRIQALWRGVLGRAKSDKIWLNRVVVPVQKNYRQRLALRYYGKERSLADYSATIIQKKFRSWLSIRRLGKALFDREMEYRMRSIKLLTSEEELAQEKLMKLMNRLLKNDYKSLAEKSMKELIRAQEAVHIKENTLIELIKQLEILSPRAMEQGWKEELEKNVKSTREELTTMKTKVLFEMRSQVHSNESRLEDLVGEIEECSDVCRRVARWRDQVNTMLHLF